jgi:hypothetical protein
MASTENTATAPADTAESAPDAENKTSATTTTTNNTETPGTAETAPVETRPTPVRIAESGFEATHSDLPPLSSIPSSAAENSAAAGPRNERPAARRGLGRGGDGSAPATHPAIGVVDDPADLSESLSGQYANGYGGNGGDPARPRRERENHRGRGDPSPVAETPPAEDAPTSGPREFIPPVSQKTVKAEMDPERERRNREEKRQFRPARAEYPRAEYPRAEYPRAEHSRQQSRQDGEFFGQRYEDRAKEWTPGGNTANGKHQGGARAFNIEAPDIPKQVEEGLWVRIKGFFANLFGSKNGGTTAPKPSGTHTGPDKHAGDGADGGRGRGGYRHGRGRRGGGGDFRHSNRNSGGNPQNYNRDGRHRPHAHGGNNRPRREGGDTGA